MVYIGDGIQAHKPRVSGAAAWWGNAIAAYDAKNAASQAASYSNLANPGTYDLTLGVAPAWANGVGWTFNGTTQYLKTEIIPQNDQSQSMLVRYTNLTAGRSLAEVFSPGGGRFGIEPNFFASRSYFNGGNLVIVGGIAAGNVGIAGGTGYVNGVPDAGVMGAWTGASTFSVFIGARNTAGVTDNFCAVCVQQIVFFDYVLTDAQMLEKATQMAAL